MAGKTKQEEMALERIMFFSDAIFAFAITLLAVMLLDYLKESNPESFLADLLRGMVAYVVSFLVIGIYWAAHHRLSQHITRFNSGLIWANMHLLVAIAFLPVPTVLLMRYSSVLGYLASVRPETNDKAQSGVGLPLENLSAILYAITLTIIGILFWRLWWYITGFRVRWGLRPPWWKKVPENFTSDHIINNGKLVDYYSFRLVFPAIMFALSTILAFFSVFWAEVVWLLVLLSNIAFAKLGKSLAKEESKRGFFGKFFGKWWAVANDTSIGRLTVRPSGISGQAYFVRANLSTTENSGDCKRVYTNPRVSGNPIPVNDAEVWYSCDSHVVIRLIATCELEGKEMSPADRLTSSDLDFVLTALEVETTDCSKSSPFLIYLSQERAGTNLGPVEAIG